MHSQSVMAITTDLHTINNNMKLPIHCHSTNHNTVKRTELPSSNRPRLTEANNRFFPWTKIEVVFKVRSVSVVNDVRSFFDVLVHFVRDNLPPLFDDGKETLSLWFEKGSDASNGKIMATLLPLSSERQRHFKTIHIAARFMWTDLVAKALSLQTTINNMLKIRSEDDQIRWCKINIHSK
jgi:hypothetical protein